MVTTFGCASRGTISVASARPTVCTVCMPAPTIRKARPAASCATQGGAQVSPDRIIRAKGIIARPPNCMIVPSQRYGTRRQPRTERWESERNPIKARSGAKSSGSATMMATRLAATPISTIMTRLSVPTINTAVMPQEIWNKERRINLLIGKGPLVDSAKGSTFRLIPVQSRAKRSFTSLISGAVPSHERYRSHGRYGDPCQYSTTRAAAHP